MGKGKKSLVGWVIKPTEIKYDNTDDRFILVMFRDKDDKLKEYGFKKVRMSIEDL